MITMENRTLELAKATSEHELILNLLHGFQMYYIPILVYLGSLGNCLSVCVIFCTKMRRTSSNFYLAALAISDTGFLVTLFVVWLGMVEVKLFDKQGFCQFFVYLTTVCSFLSAWFVVAFTVERFVAVRYPLRLQWMCTVSRAKTILLSITLVGLVVCSPVLLFSKPQTAILLNTTTCSLAEEWQKWASAYNVIDTVLTFVIPFCLIVVLNGLIVKSVGILVRVRRTLTIELGAQQGDGERSSGSQSPRGVMHQQKVTKMLLMVSSVFLCFNLPAYVIRIYIYVLIQKNEETHHNLNLVIAQQISNLLFNTNFGINFVLYCATGQNFRTIVVRILCRRCRRRADKTSSLTQRSSQRNLFVMDSDRSGGSMSRHRTITINGPWTDTHEMQSFCK